jgi:hypothetical protein
VSLATTITSNLDETARALASAEQRAEARLRAINIRANRDLLRFVKANVVHVRSGNLRDHLVVIGPFDVATGALEATIEAPGVPYAAIEAERGGAHDWATRGVDEGEAILEKAAQDMERAIVEEMERG